MKHNSSTNVAVDKKCVNLCRLELELADMLLLLSAVAQHFRVVVSRGGVGIRVDSYSGQIDRVAYD
jgi:hypothetical protein